MSISAGIDMLRYYIGLDNSNMMQIVAVTADIVKSKLRGNTNVHHTEYHCPKAAVVPNHMKTGKP